MTSSQYDTINKLHKGFLENKEEYAEWNPDDYCSFRTYRNESNKEDKHIVCVWVRISGLNDFGIPDKEILNFLIEPSGAYYDMDMVTGVFESRNQMIEYIQKLTKFDWSGK